MNLFHLNIVTPDGQFYSEDISKLVLRTRVGDLTILKNRAPIISPLGIGRVKIVKDNIERIAAVVDGYVSVDGNYTTVVTKAAEWADEIDIDRALDAKQRAEEALERRDEGIDVIQAELALNRALNRIEVSQRTKKNS